MRLSRIFTWCLIASVLLAPTVPIALFYVLPFYVDPWPFAAIGALVVAFFIVALGCAVSRENGRAPRLMASGMIVGALALAGWIAAVCLANGREFETWLRLIVWPTGWACLMMLLGLVLLPRRGWRWWVWLRGITIALLALMAAFICLAVTFQPTYDWRWGPHPRVYDEQALRYGALLALFTVGAMVATFLSPWMMALIEKPGGRVASVPYRLLCPRCGRRQSARTGEHHCTRCGLRIQVELT
jgi:hypothetical protein